MSNCFIILAAGNSNRFISKIPKPYIKYKGDILINHSINKAILSKKFSKIVVAINKSHKKYIKKLSKNKGFSDTSANRYSLALYELASETKSLKNIEENSIAFLNY